MNQKKNFVSIIIPLHVVSDRFFRDLKRFNNLDYANYEILVVCNNKIALPKVKHCRLIVTGQSRSSPAEKRDYAVKYAKGDILAYIDDDAYPDSQWLSRAIADFNNDSSLVAVGGPGLTPREDSFMAKLGGSIYESYLASGKLQHRFINWRQTKRFVQDWPAYNLFIKKEFLYVVGGWESAYYGGEDTYICLKLISKGRILYDPDVIVFHHRRELFRPHLRQLNNIGIHRGYFFKKYPKTSRDFIYILPLTLTIGLLCFIVGSFLNIYIFYLFITIFLLAYLLACISVRKNNHLKGILIAGLGLIASHISYGIGFLMGLLTKKLIH